MRGESLSSENVLSADERGWPADGNDGVTAPGGGNDPVRGFFWLGVTYVCGTIFYLTSKVLLDILDRDVFIVWWYLFGLLFHIGYGLTQKKTVAEPFTPREHRLLGAFVLIDLVSTVTMFMAIQIMDPGVVSFIAQSQLLFVLLFSYLLLGEVLVRREVMAAILIVAGIVVMSYRSPQVPLAGGILLAVWNLAAALGLIIVRQTGGTVGSLTLARLRNIALFIVFFILNIARNGRIMIPPVPVIAFLAMGSFFGPFLNTISIFKTIENIPVGKVSLFRSIQPLFVAIAAYFLLGTFPGVRETAGGVVMIAGSALLAYFHSGHQLMSVWPLRGFRR